VKPETVQNVAKAIKVLNSDEFRSFKVAIRSGGHAPYASNNVQDGVTTDLGRLNSITYGVQGRVRCCVYWDWGAVG